MITYDQELIDALQFHKTGNLQEAELLYKKVLQINPKEDLALHYYGILCYSLGRTDEAIDYLINATQINPTADLYKDLAEIYVKKDLKGEALECYHKALQLNPNDASLFHNVGMIFYNEKLYDDAVKSFKVSCELLPDSPTYSYTLALVLHNINDLDNAELYYKKTIELDCNNEASYYNLGLIAYQKNQYDAAIKYLSKSIEINPHNPVAYNNLATIYQDLYDIENAVINYEKAVNADPQNLLYSYNLGRALLSKGDYERGWVLFDESRIGLFTHHNLRFPPEIKPKWSGEPLQDKSIYVYTSGGFGDDILFARYLPELHRKGAKVLLRARKELVDIFRQSSLGIEILDDLTPDSEIEFDYQIPTMSLGRAFSSNIETIPNKDGYLKADAAKVQEYKEKYFNTDLFKVGIVWTCQDPDRSVLLKHFLPLSKIPGVRMYSFQKEFGSDELNNLKDEMSIVDLDTELKDFTDTAAAAANLDLFISIDTSPLHLVGALGEIPVWALLKYSPDWRWAYPREQDFWYSSVKLFRQNTPDKWEEVFERMRLELISKLS